MRLGSLISSLLNTVYVMALDARHADEDFVIIVMNCLQRNVRKRRRQVLIIRETYSLSEVLESWGMELVDGKIQFKKPQDKKLKDGETENEDNTSIR